MLKNTIVLLIVLLISACVHVKQESEQTGISVGDTLRLRNDAIIVKCHVHESTITAWLSSGEYKNDKCLMNKTSASFGRTIIGRIEAPKYAKVSKIIEHAMLGNYTSYIFIKVTDNKTTYIVSHYDLERLFESDIHLP